MAYSTFTEHRFHSQNCWIRELWILGPGWRKLYHAEDEERREDMWMKKAKSCPISLRLQDRNVGFSMPSNLFFWAPSDFPGSSFHRFPYISQSSLQPSLCSKIVLPFKEPFVPEVKTEPTFSVAFLESTGFGTTQNWPAIPDAHLISWIASSILYKIM